LATSTAAADCSTKSSNGWYLKQPTLKPRVLGAISNEEEEQKQIQITRKEQEEKTQ